MSKFFLIALAIMLIAGCRQGGSDSGGGSGLSSSFDSRSVSGGSSSSSGVTTGAPVVNPEPSTVALLGIGLAGLVAAKLLRKRKRQ